MILKKADNYDEIEVNQEFTPLELGGHKGIIKKVEEYTSEISGNTSLKVAVDTDSTDKQPHYYQEQFDNNTNADKKWSTGATKYVSLKEDENCVRMLKAFITAVENSNPNFTYDWNKDINQLNGKKVGLVFGWEEYEKQDGSIGTATKLTQFRSIDKVDNVKIPKVKLLDGSFVEYESYHKSTTNEVPSEFTNITVVDNDDSPFEI
ncbi:MAG: hypothetical protein IKN65_00920 [Clostridia bacterium]|nr:hypothetical protein [Bacilli bacterium]MBR3672846.1 hypothetical protein [Clostridia bacterium]